MGAAAAAAAAVVVEGVLLNRLVLCLWMLVEGTGVATGVGVVVDVGTVEDSSAALLKRAGTAGAEVSKRVAMVRPELKLLSIPENLTLLSLWVSDSVSVSVSGWVWLKGLVASKGLVVTVALAVGARTVSGLM